MTPPTFPELYVQCLVAIRSQCRNLERAVGAAAMGGGLSAAAVRRGMDEDPSPFRLLDLTDMPSSARAFDVKEIEHLVCALKTIKLCRFDVNSQHTG